MLKIGMLLDNEFTGDMRVENEVESLVAAGFSVYLLCFNYGSKPTEETYHGGKIFRKSVNKKWINKIKALNNTAVDLYTPMWAKMARDFVSQHDIDVLHVHDLHLVAAALKARKGLTRHIPIVADLHENYPAALAVYQYANTFPGKYVISVPKWRECEKKWLVETEYVITVIEEALDRYSKLGVPTEKLSVVANYVNREEFAGGDNVNPELEERFAGKFVLSYLGGFDAHRGLEETIRAVAIAKSSVPNIQLVLVGQGRNFAELEQLVIDLGVENEVSLEGWQPPANLPGYLTVSDICLIPHVKSEHTDHTIPHKLFQYMYLEKPVIASNCNPLERILNETGAGVVYPSGNENEMAKQIIHLAGNTELRQEMGRKGKRSVNEKYNWQVTAANLVSLYQGIAESAS